MAEDIVGNRYRVSFVDICAVSLFIWHPCSDEWDTDVLTLFSFLDLLFALNITVALFLSAPA